MAGQPKSTFMFVSRAALFTYLREVQQNVTNQRKCRMVMILRLFYLGNEAYLLTRLVVLRKKNL